MDNNDDFAQFSMRFAQALHNSQGKPFVFDHDGMRTLHLDGRFIQSAMRIAAPNELLLSYTKAMTAFLLINPAPRHILMIGLGGGSLAKFCYQQLRATRITVLESERDVIALRHKFSIPADNARFRVVHADAAEYLAVTRERVDVILHDGFDADGQAPGLCSEHFYLQCERVLDDDGILVLNLLGDTDDLLPTMLGLHSVFGQAMWWADAAGCFNRIVLAKKCSYPAPSCAVPLRIPAEEALRDAPALHDFVARARTAWGRNRTEFALIAAYDGGAAFAVD